MIATTIKSSIKVKPRWLLMAGSSTDPDTGFIVDIRMVAGVAWLSFCRMAWIVAVPGVELNCRLLPTGCRPLSSQEKL